MSTRSIVNQITGMPRDCDTNTRIYLFTSWTREGIQAALRKLREARKLDHTAFHRHLGETGMHGDEWWSFVARLDCNWVAENWKGKIADRYGMQRWVWTTATDFLSEEAAAARVSDLTFADVTGTPAPGKVIMVDDSGVNLSWVYLKQSKTSGAIIPVFDADDYDPEGD